VTAPIIQLPQHVLKELQEASARMGGLPLDDLVAAAVRAFHRLDAAYRSNVIREFWLAPLAGARRPKMTLGRRLYELVRSGAAHVARRVAR
jgi:hypothetical protein